LDCVTPVVDGVSICDTRCILFGIFSATEKNRTDQFDLALSSHHHHSKSTIELTGSMNWKKGKTMAASEKTVTPDQAAAAPAIHPFPARPDGPVPGIDAPVTPAKPWRRRAILGTVVLAVLVAGAIWGYGWWTDGRFMVTTDDAYIQADIAAIAPRIQGYVQTVAVVENQQVAAGDVIANLDNGDYRIALATATSKIASQTATLARIEAQTAAVGLAKAQQQAAEAVLHNADLTAERTQTLVEGKSLPQAKLDDAAAARDEARATVAGAKAQVESAKANVAVLEAQYAEAESQTKSINLAVEQAQRNLDLTVLKAPYAGIVANIAVERGDLVSPGQRLAAIVPTDALYVEANYKETQLEQISAGALVHVTVDALPGQTFDGHVVSLAPATGSMFSILPASNATGNFTKVVQRVPVRINLPADVLSKGVLRAGLSVVVDIDSRTAN
jgi:membrane fusion protein, multidrug efflux system